MALKFTPVPGLLATISPLSKAQQPCGKWEAKDAKGTSLVCFHCGWLYRDHAVEGAPKHKKVTKAEVQQKLRDAKFLEVYEKWREIAGSMPIRMKTSDWVDKNFPGVSGLDFQVWLNQGPWQRLREENLL